MALINTPKKRGGNLRNPLVKARNAARREFRLKNPNYRCSQLKFWPMPNS